jgi:hypothetical protein
MAAVTDMGLLVVKRALRLAVSARAGSVLPSARDLSSAHCDCRNATSRYGADVFRARRGA